MIQGASLTLLTILFIATVSPLSTAQPASPSRAANAVDSMPHARGISEAVISPDGTQVAYVIQGKLTIVSTQTNTAHAIEAENQLPVRGIAWSADSKLLAMIADMPGDIPAAQIWTIASDGSSPVKRAEVKGNVDAPLFSPDGSKLAMLYTEGMPRKAGPLQPMTPLSGVVGDKIYEQRLTTIDLSTNTLQQVSPLDIYVYEYNWTPDGRSWVATAAHGSGDANWYVAKLYRITAASGDMHELYSPKRQIAEPHVSPDGKNVAFIEGLMSDEGSTGGDIFVIPSTGGQARNLTPGIKSSPSALAWTGNDRITFAEYIDGKSGFGSVSLSGSAVKTIWSGDEYVGSVASPGATFAKDGATTAVIRQSPNTPPEVWAGEIGLWKQLSNLNTGLTAAWGETHSYHWTSGNFRIQGWLTFPKDYDAAKKYPLVVNVHGGPSSACAARWDTRTAGPQSAMGYFSLCPNLRGSYGLGEAFTQANIKDFGGGDFRDLMAGIDALAAEYPIDPRRIGIRGHSYGGYMTMWAETQTHRFAAAVAGAGLSDWLSYYGVNEIDEWMMPFFGASVYDDPAIYAKSDPMHFVKKVQTPTLILVGDSDGEVPMEQSVEWWHALEALKVPTQLVVYPNEGHVFFKPADARDYAVRGLEWFDEWFGKAAATKQAAGN